MNYRDQEAVLRLSTAAGISPQNAETAIKSGSLDHLDPVSRARAEAALARMASGTPARRAVHHVPAGPAMPPPPAPVQPGKPAQIVPRTVGTMPVEPVGRVVPVIEPEDE